MTMQDIYYHLADRVVLHQCDGLARDVWRMRSRVLLDKGISAELRTRVSGALKAIYDELTALSTTEIGGPREIPRPEYRGGD